MKFTSKALAAAVAVTLAAPAVGQNAADPGMTDPYPVEQEDDDSGKWGLLGLLGLAGLLGRKRRDHDDDIRRTGTGTINR